MAYFEWENGRRTVDLNAGSHLIGRAPYAQILIPDDMGCSREQARIASTAQGWCLTPISQNTVTYVNGAAAANPVVLADGDVIAFSEQRLVFKDGSSAETAFLDPAASQPPSAMPPPVAPSASRRQTPATGEIVIGRSSEQAEFTLDHPTVSRRHALFAAGPNAEIRDLGSTNGTFVNGAPVKGRHTLSAGDRVEIGPFSLVYDGSSLALQARHADADLSGIGLCVDVPSPNGGVQRILDNATVKINPQEFVCIVGPSGSGKSSLIRVLSGRNVPTSGTVMVGDLDLFENFESLKQDISFVPQHDVLHETLGLETALTYTAMLRLPEDTSAKDRTTLVRAAAQDVELGDRLGNRIGTLSGGQKKRASLASETLSKPELVFLDEVTSGLDEATDREIMRTLRQKAAGGMTIVCVTHTMANVEEFCDRLVVMAEGGIVVFDGPPRAALDFFKVERLGQIFDQLKAHPTEHWVSLGHRAPPPSAASRQAGSPFKRSFSKKDAMRAVRQFVILSRRNANLIVADRRGLAMAAAQSILIGVLVGYAFNDFGSGFEVVSSQNALLLLLGLCAIWLGCNSASQEIVGELQIFKREYDVNLSVVAFVLSKFTVSTAYTGLQFCVAFGLVAVFAQDIPGPPVQQLLYLLVGCLAGTAMGLLLSSVANTNEQATMIVPLTLVPQLIFAGVLVPKLPDAATVFAEVAVSGYWLTEGLKSNLIAEEGPIRVIDVSTGRPAEMTAASAEIGTIVILLHCIVFLALAVYFSARRASR